MKDSSDIIVTAVLCILAYIGYLGWVQTQKDYLNARMDFAENRWEHAREVNREKWREHCAIRTAGWANELGKYYEPEAVVGVWRDCVR